MTGILYSERLTLRPFLQSDAAQVTTYINDPRIYLNVGRIKPGQSVAETRNWIASHASGTAGETDFVRAIMSDNVILGAVGAHRQARTDPFEIGYWIAPEAWGHGYATEAAKTLIGWLEATRDTRVTVSGHFADNPASGRVLSKLGYLYAGRSTMFCLGRGETVERRDMVRIA